MGEESERQGMNHGNSAVSHPRSRVRMTDGRGDNSRPLPPAFGRKRGGWKMLKLPFTCAEQWGGNGSHTVVESQPDHPTPTPRASVTECLSTGGSPEVQPLGPCAGLADCLSSPHHLNSLRDVRSL